MRPLFYAVHSVFPADHRDDGREYRHLAAGNYCVGRRIAHGQLDLAVGAALGSNITNILLILGLAALVRPFTVHSDVLRRELPLMLFVSVVAGSVLHDGQLSRSDGIFLLLLAVLWLLFIVKSRVWPNAGNDSLTREQLAELPREGGLPSRSYGWALRWSSCRWRRAW